jgi:predicted CXXCH cytochrome family protein
MIPLIALLLLAAAPVDESTYPAPLKEFLAAKNKDGSPVLSAEDHQALAALPEHTRKLIGDAAESMILGSAAHLKILLSLELAPSAFEVVAQDNCILCHSDPGNQKGKTLFATDPSQRKSNPLLNLKEFVSDVHFRRGLSCAGCHGGKPKDDMMTKEIAARWPSEEARHKGRSWIPQFCARCHADPNFMRGFNPTLATDQLAKYKDSLHGIRLLQEKDSRAAQCVSCHGVHGIRNSKSRKSMVHAQQIPDTCGSCHADPKHMEGYKLLSGAPFPTTQLAEYKLSVHGKALLEKGDLGAPACTGCHGSHAAMPPEVASVAQVCRRCHVQNGNLFDGSRHKKAFEEHKWPECGQCHGKHGIAKPSDALIGDTLGTLCKDCHAVYAKGNRKCDATAAIFRASLDKLAAGRAEIAGQMEGLAERGLDVEPLARTVGDLDEALVQARSRIHSFDESIFQSAAQPGNEALAKSRELIVGSRQEARFRTRGLLAAIGFMSLIAVGIALKLREIGKRRGDDGR